MQQILLYTFVLLLAVPAIADHGSLSISWMGVVDNGEGDKWPHGPHGNLHLQVFDNQGSELLHTVIKGPSENEWVDGDESHFSPRFLLYRWRSPDDKVTVKIWESDPGPFRSHDTIFEETIDRKSTNDPRLIWYGTAAEDALSNIVRRRPSWLKNLPDGVPRNAKTYVRFVTQVAPKSSSYRWIYRGYGDIGHHDISPPSEGGTPHVSRCNETTLGLGAVCPTDDPSKCHYKNVSAANVVHGNGGHPGKVYECVGPSAPEECSYKWVHRGHGDIGHHDLPPPTSGGRPLASRCNSSTAGLGAVCPDDDPSKCHYKNVPARRVLTGGGGHPGKVYECVCE